MEHFEVKMRLKEILSEFVGFGNFSINSMSNIEKRALEVKSLAIRILGAEDEVTAEMESVILISKEYHRKNLGLETELIKEALIHLEYGTALFIEKI